MPEHRGPVTQMHTNARFDMFHALRIWHDRDTKTTPSARGGEGWALRVSEACLWLAVSWWVASTGPTFARGF